MEKHVGTVAELLSATGDSRIGTIVLTGDLVDVPSFDLSPGQTLRSASGQRFALTFAQSVDGVRLSSDNSILSLDLCASSDKRAIWNDYSVPALGRISLGSVNTFGRVQLLARDHVRDGHVEVDRLAILAADSRGERDRPHEYGVNVIQGAFTLWNMQPDQDVTISADLIDISVGRFGSPVLGSGIFVSGAGDQGGDVKVQRLQTGAVYSDGRIAPGATDQITSGVFVVYGAHVDAVRNNGPVVTYGTNDMALDNWGTVDRWLAKEKITTFGPSGIGFVNFGTIRQIRVEGPIETFGPGARGFNVYTGTVHRAEFDRIVTHADGAVGAQIGQPIGELIVRRGIETFGGTGPSLVKGVVTNLPAIALSIKKGGSVQRIKIEGGIRTHGKGVSPLEQLGSVQNLRVDGGLSMAGADPSTDSGYPQRP
jgi:hypothetical protein